MSERGDRIDRGVEKEGDDWCRRKVMARLETATHTHTHAHSLTHTKEKNSGFDITDDSIIDLYTIKPSGGSKLLQNSADHVPPPKFYARSCSFISLP